MRLARSLPSLGGALSLLRRAGGVLRESLLLAAALALVEAAGPYAIHDGVDLLVLLGVLLGGALLLQAVRAGWMPGTRRLALGLRARGRRVLAGLSPRYAVAFRPRPGAEALPDRTLARPTLWTLLALVAFAWLGPRTLEALTFLKEEVAYTLYLAGLALLWSVFVLTTALGCVAAAQWLQAVSRRRGGSPAPFLLFGAAWAVGLVLLAVLPGIVPLLGVLVLGWVAGRGLAHAPRVQYLFCRRDEQGRSRTIPVHAYVRQLHRAMVLLLALVVVLGQAQRLWFADWPTGRFALTTWLGVLASLCALLLVVRAGAHFRHLGGAEGLPPEVPLTPSLWIPDASGPRPARWGHLARESGWLVLDGAGPPGPPYDLVLDRTGDTRRFLPRDTEDDADARFQLTRRFHVVMRRRFHRHFRALFKRLRAERPAEGTGYLFCPHVWLVPGVVRDGDVRDRSRAGGSLVGPMSYGPPFVRAFPERVRRYVGAILRDLEVDILFWEDAVPWGDLRRVLGVMYEIHDQGRAPVQERHFMGLPRVRVVLQEEEAEVEPPPAVPRRGAAPRPPAPGHARLLLVFKDRGRGEEDHVPDPVGHGVRTPSLV